MSKQIVIAPDRKTAFTLNENGEMLNSLSGIRFEYDSAICAELMLCDDQIDKSKALAMPECLNWLQDGAPVIYRAADIKKVLRITTPPERG
jgi:hypothetical protein